MAEAIARRAAAELGMHGVVVASAGVDASEGDGASIGALRAARRHGLDLEGHRAHRITPGDVAGADLILAMGPRHLSRVADLGGRGKAHLLAEFASPGGAGRPGPGVPDPFGGTDDDYEATFTLLEELVHQTLRRIATR